MPTAQRSKSTSLRFRTKAGHYARQQFHAAASSAPNGRPLGANPTTLGAAINLHYFRSVSLVIDLAGHRSWQSSSATLPVEKLGGAMVG